MRLLAVARQHGLCVTTVIPVKRLNRSKCRLACQIVWARGTVHMGAIWRIRLDSPCSVAMRVVATSILITYYISVH